MNIKLLQIIIIGLCCGMYSQPTAAQQMAEQEKVTLKNWMSNIKDEVSIAALSIPGTHDSGADFGCTKRIATPYAKAQNWTIAQQLENGIRYLDIRCRRTGTSFSIHHAQCYQQKQFGEVLNDCRDFLLAHPTETILMRIKEEYDAEENALSFSAIFDSYKNRYPDLWYDLPDIPTMQEARGKIVIINNAAFEGGISYANQTYVQDEYYFKKKKEKWAPVQQHLLEAQNTPVGDYLVLNHLSATGYSGAFWNLVGVVFRTVPDIKDFSDYIQPLAEDFLESNSQGRYGVLILDFPTEQIIPQIIESNIPAFCLEDWEVFRP